MMEKVEEMFGISSQDITTGLVQIGIKLAVAIGIIIVGFWIAKMAAKGVRRLLTIRDTDKSLITFMSSLVTIGLKILTLITAITQLGVEMTSFVALLGAAGLAIGLAFSGTLANFAGGIMILLFKPFKIGDFVQVQDEEGIVSEILIFNTILKTRDNKVIILANGPVANGTIVNFTKADVRRVDWTFGIAYGDDLKVAKEILAKFGAEDEKILSDPEPMFVGLGELGNSSVNLHVKAWTKTDDYWDVFFKMNERVYNEFGAAGLSIPFPQMDVHIQKV